MALSLINLNIQGGIEYSSLITFLKNNSSTDIFCFQEVFNNGHTNRPVFKKARMDIFHQIENVLPNHQGIFYPEQENEEGVAMFISNNVHVGKEGWLFIHRWENIAQADGRVLTRILQWARVINKGKEYTICHFHGVWQREGKNDTSERLKQSPITSRLI